LIRKRKAGIQMAREMLAQGLEHEEVRALLDEIAKRDHMMGVQELAQDILNEDNARNGPQTFAPAGYVFGGVCSNGHTSYYDKREYCPKSSNVTRRTVQRGAQKVDEILVKCKTKSCGEEFFVEVSCEGFK
jgi:hypothetical protein